MKRYQVPFVDSEMEILDKRWADVPALRINEVWENYYPSPYHTEARVVHSRDGITVKFTTDEWPLRADRTTKNSMICEDSCLEFFITPNEEEEQFINFEINPFGVAHVGIGKDRHERTLLDFDDYPLRRESFIRAEKEWSLLLFVPYSFLDAHFSSRGKTMKANFYKCGDFTVKKHFSVWNPIEVEIPDYHRPEFFGRLDLL